VATERATRRLSAILAADMWDTAGLWRPTRPAHRPAQVLSAGGCRSRNGAPPRAHRQNDGRRHARLVCLRGCRRGHAILCAAHPYAAAVSYLPRGRPRADGRDWGCAAVSAGAFAAAPSVHGRRGNASTRGDFPRSGSGRELWRGPAQGGGAGMSRARKLAAIMAAGTVMERV
jgi:hypothetical protein